LLDYKEGTLRFDYLTLAIFLEARYNADVTDSLSSCT